MPRKPRFFVPGVAVHIVQRGRSREPVFFEESDYLAFLGWLKEAALRYHCDVHAYALMTNHTHILATPADAQGITRMMQYVGRQYVPYVNHTYGSSGSIWEGRYKASLVQDDQYLLTCMRYIELNPVRAKMVRSPSKYRWSSYVCNGEAAADELITPHALYSALGRGKVSQARAYKALFDDYIDRDTLVEIEAAWQTGTPLGDARFQKQIEKKLNLKVGQARRGRPRKEVGDNAD